MGTLRTFETFWNGLYPSTQQKMNKTDASFIWMCRAHDVKQAEMRGRHQAMCEVIDKLKMQEMYDAVDFVTQCMTDDRSYDFFKE